MALLSSLIRWSPYLSDKIVSVRLDQVDSDELLLFCRHVGRRCHNFESASRFAARLGGGYDNCSLRYWEEFKKSLLQAR